MSDEPRREPVTTDRVPVQVGLDHRPALRPGDKSECTLRLLVPYRRDSFRAGVRLELSVHHLAGGKHLPIVELKRAA